LWKVRLLLLIAIFSTGCSISRKSRSVENHFNMVSGKIDKVILEGLNITRNSFYVQKAEFSFLSDELELDGIATIKFEWPDKYLISIKNKIGIEGVRALITKDSIVINDRLNKKLYYCSGEYIKKKFGTSPSLIPILFGDYINESSVVGVLECEEGKIITEGIVDNLSIRYIISCLSGKTLLAERVNNSGNVEAKIVYSKFFKENSLIYPGIIKMSENMGHTRLKIKILRLEYPWSGMISFIPGNQYDKIRLK
jgi:hypothetical protein